MPLLRHCLATCALAAALVGPSHAVPLAADGAWVGFDVAQDLAGSGGLEWIDVSSGDALSFSFTLGAGETATLTVVDAGFAGDSFSILDGATLLGLTSAPTSSYDSFATADFDEALADSRFSRGVFVFGEGSYEISGVLAQSVVLPGNVPLNTTLGGLKLELGTVSAVPEPGTYAVMLAGLGLLSVALRLRSH